MGGPKTKAENTHISWLLNLRNLGLIVEEILLASFAAMSSHHICTSVPDLVIRIPAYLEGCTEK